MQDWRKLPTSKLLVSPLWVSQTLMAICLTTSVQEEGRRHSLSSASSPFPPYRAWSTSMHINTHSRSHNSQLWILLKVAFLHCSEVGLSLSIPLLGVFKKILHPKLTDLCLRDRRAWAWVFKHTVSVHNCCYSQTTTCIAHCNNHSGHHNSGSTGSTNLHRYPGSFSTS